MERLGEARRNMIEADMQQRMNNNEVQVDRFVSEATELLGI
jgi:hypothetical protein